MTQTAPFDLPLRVTGSETTLAVWIADNHSRRVLTVVNGLLDYDRAQFTARAVNSHDALVKALEYVVKFADSEPDGGETVAMHRANIERARAALALASAA